MDAPRFTPCRSDDEMRSGWHVARRHDTPDPRRFELIYLDVWADDRGNLFALHRCGTGTVENPMEWEFCHRVVGLHSPCDDTLDLDAVEISAVRH
ncbi:hypothetical protein FV226_24610 [Methylobacterium sp. WL12]|uniref:hypothetical protein n=1 Tax=Methylobacterium sp. WL12 TaxID=2603890 RepID=UPI0011CB959F|nr:hypothetical protein [Methylobacterium sp. WL12]TXM65677.1 hypothetical protein FV226_24610 [Methylobacterium sp. WL12]